MRKKTILACSDPLTINTGMSKQMKLLMGNYSADWYYVENGILAGEDRERKIGKNMITVYPGRSSDPSASQDEVHRLADDIKPDLVFVHEDAQHLFKYLRRTKHEFLLWWPHDSDIVTDISRALLETSIYLGYTVAVTSMASCNLFKEAGYLVPVLYNMADEKTYYPFTEDGRMKARAKFFAKLGVVNPNVLFYNGRMTARKNIEGLFGMAEHLHKLRDDFLLLLNTDPRDPNRSCDPIIEAQTRDLEGHVVINAIKFDHGISAEELNELYNISDVYVSATVGEGFNIPVTEAGLCNKPFVIPGNTTGPEFSMNSDNGLCVPLDVYERNVGNIHRLMPDIKEMAEMINRLLDVPKKMEFMGTAFRKHVLKYYSVEVVTKKFGELVDSFCPKEVESYV